jgi:hypothetical protein
MDLKSTMPPIPPRFLDFPTLLEVLYPHIPTSKTIEQKSFPIMKLLSIQLMEQDGTTEDVLTMQGPLTVPFMGKWPMLFMLNS